MPKFKKEEFVIVTKGDNMTNLLPGEREVIRFTTDIHINASGTFYIKVPEDLVIRCKENDITLNTFYINRSKTIENTISAETYEKLLERVKTVLRPLIEFTIESETYVIRYSFGGNVHYNIGPDGSLEFNGVRKDGKKGSWADTGHNQWNEPYSVNVGVEVHSKKVILYPGDKRKTVYNKVNSVDQAKFPELHELLRVVRIKAGSNYTEIEYTEQIALALHTGVMGIIKLYDSLHKFNHVETFLEYADNLNNQKLLNNE